MKRITSFLLGVVAAVVLFLTIQLPGAASTSMIKSSSENGFRPRFSNAVASRGKADGRARVDRDYGTMPLVFEANHGQTSEEVKFLSRGRNHTLFLTQSEAVFVLTSGQIGAPARRASVRMRLSGANQTPEVEGLAGFEGRSNYLIGRDPAKWRRNVPTYGKVRYRGVYPGIDLIYYGNQRLLEYDFLVSPGADVAKIVLDFKGVDRLEIDADGDLVLHTAAGSIRQRMPIVYQDVEDGRRDVPGRYVLRGRHHVGFQIGDYDPRLPLVIDPVLIYSSYLGGSGFDFASGVTVDDSGYAYVVGITDSIDFPVSAGAFQAGLNGPNDVFVTKINPTGSALIYSTYLGGSGTEQVGAFGHSGIALDAATGEIYVAGSTDSSDFPVSGGAFQTSMSGPGDAFVSKLSSTGTELVYSTYLGGSSADGALGVTVNIGGEVFVAGMTSSDDFPVTAGAFQTTRGGDDDAFVTKLNAAGTGLIYSTYLGGTDHEDARAGVAIDSSGHAHVSGVTTSIDFPTTPGAFQNSHVGSNDTFVAKLDLTGSALIYSTYLAGSGGEDPRGGIAVDGLGYAYAAGQTSSADFPTTTGAVQPVFGGDNDGYVTKLDPSGSVVYSTYLGGPAEPREDQVRAIAADASGNVYVTGYTESTNFPVTVDAFQAESGGSADAFVTKINPTGSSIVYSSYFGGSQREWGTAIAADNLGVVYLAGITRSPDFPIVSGSFQPIQASTDDAFVARIILETDIDGDGIFDSVDPDPTDGPTGDPESDGVPTNSDNCPSAANSDQVDADGDGLGDACDVNIGATSRVSVDSAGAEADGSSDFPSISADGRYVVFPSDATNLVAGDTNGQEDIFVHDRQTGSTTRVSTATDGTVGDDGGPQSNAGSNDPVISGDGRFVAFDSNASDLVADDGNDVGDVFVHDRQSGVTTRVSVATGSSEGDGSSLNPAISADGRFVAFRSAATNLVEGDTNGVIDVFVHDLQSGVTERVSLNSAGEQAEGGGAGSRLSISGDGRFVAFPSGATNLVEDDTNGINDIFVRDRQSGTTQRVSIETGGIESNGSSGFPEITPDGRFVTFESNATNLFPGDTNGETDIFVHDRDMGITERVSVSTAGFGGDGEAPSISADGRFVAFESPSPLLIPGDTNGAVDVFVHDRQAHTTERVSVGSGGAQSTGAGTRVFGFAISADGRFVAYRSSAPDLVPGDTNSVGDVFVRDRGFVDGDGDGIGDDIDPNPEDGPTGDLDLDATPNNADNCPTVANPAQSDGDGDGVGDACEPIAGTIHRVSVDSSSVEADGVSGDDVPATSADGRFVAFESEATNLVPGDTNNTLDVFVHDRLTQTTERVSIDNAGAEGNSFSGRPTISGDGRFVAFQSGATNLVAGDTNAAADVFVHDRQTHSTERVSVDSTGSEANGASVTASISADGRFVAFASSATNLAGTSVDVSQHVFVHDRKTGSTELVSVDSNELDGNNGSSTPSISDDGRFIAFQSDATNLVETDTNGVRDVFVRDLELGITERVSIDSTGTEANGLSITREFSISADGRFVAFDSRATNLAGDDTNDVMDVFVRDRNTGSTQRVSVASTGPDQNPNGRSEDAAISPDGRFVAFGSAADNLVDGDINDAGDLFIYDRYSGVTERVSRSDAGTEGDGGSEEPSLSHDGTLVAFLSHAANLIEGDTNGVRDVFVRTRIVEPLEPAGDFDGDTIANGDDNCPTRINPDQGDADSDGAGDACDLDDDNDGQSDSLDNCVLTGNTDQADLDGDGIGDACDPISDGPSGDLDGDGVVNLVDNCPTTANPDQTDADGDGIGDACDANPNDGPVADPDSDGIVNSLDNCPGSTNADQADLDGDGIGNGCDATLGTTERVHLNSAGAEVQSDVRWNAISADGRFVAFSSGATNLVPGDTNDAFDVFIRDRLTGAVERISVDSAGIEADFGGSQPSISADGRFVAFQSGATNLVGGDTNGLQDTFVRDRVSGTTERVSVDSVGTQAEGGGVSDPPAISADGRLVAFVSRATNLVSDDTNDTKDVFVHDRQTGITERVSVDSSGIQGDATSGDENSLSFSADGRYVAFTSSASNLVAGDTNGARDSFVHDRLTGATERISVSSAGVQGSVSVSDDHGSSLSGDGRYVVFTSRDGTLVAGDSNNSNDVFVHDRVTGTTERVSVSSAGLEGNGSSRNRFTPSISADGRFVVFDSSATNLVQGDTNDANDVFVRDRLMATTERISVGSAGPQGDSHSSEGIISADGRFVVFVSDATNLVDGDTNTETDVFVRDRDSNTPSGGGVEVSPVDPVTGTQPASLVFTEVTTPGSTSLAISNDGPSVPAGFSLGEPATYYEIATTAEFNGAIAVCINYTGVSFQDENELRLLHFEGGAWVDQTSSLDTDANVICALVTSLSPFAVVQQQIGAVLTSLAPARIWVGVKSNAGGNKGEPRFDLRAEVLKNGVVVGSGYVDNLPGGGSGFGNAILQTIPLALTAQTPLTSGDTVSIRLSIRMGATGPQTATARLWYNDAGADTRFGATIDGVTNDYFLVGTPPFTLSLTTASGKKTIDMDLDRAVGGNPYKPFGTWTFVMP